MGTTDYFQSAQAHTSSLDHPDTPWTTQRTGERPTRLPRHYASIAGWDRKLKRAPSPPRVAGWTRSCGVGSSTSSTC